VNWSSTGATALALAVILGAFGAHQLRGILDADSARIYETAVMYHFFHALGLLIVSIMPKLGYLSPRQSGWVCGLLSAGVVLFSGSLYVLAVTRIQILGAITPLGGVSFIAAWVGLAWMLLRNEGQKDK
jgi:uncharacterized membrane protein YgdD (TMEM256/DUF423 family)